MTTGTHPAEVQTHDVGIHIVTWTVSILGLIAAAIGTWFATVEEGTITLFDRVYERSDLSESWAPALLIIGGAAALIGMVTSAFRDYEHGETAWLVALEAVLAVIGGAAIVFGIVLMF